MFSKGLIPSYSRPEIIHSHGQSKYDKAEKLVNVIWLHLLSSYDPNQYLANVCQVLIDNEDSILQNIAANMLQQLGTCINALLIIIIDVLLGSSINPTDKKILDIKNSREVLNVLMTAGFSATKWQDLGIYLGLSLATINVTAIDHKDSARCLEECLAKWLKRDYDTDRIGAPTWTLLVSAIQKTGEYAVADHISMEKIKYQQNCKLA